jgi:F-type H+-transporting ATPase subunit a
MQGYTKVVNSNTYVSQQKKVKGYFRVVRSIFIILVLTNIWGVFPYIFGVTTQIVVTFTISIILWLAIILSSLIYKPILFLGHLTPRFSPLWLVPLLKIVELVSKFVRPLTLSLRLRIKMTTGHIFIRLLRIRLSLSYFLDLW